MNKKEYKENLDMIKKFRKEILTNKEKAQKFLVQTGIVDKKGKLTVNYK